MLAFGPAGGALAHRTNLSTSVVKIDGREVSYELTVSAHDLAVAVGIETDLIAPVPRQALAAREADIGRYVGDRLYFEGSGARCVQKNSAIDLNNLPDTVILRLAYVCPAGSSAVRLSYSVFFDIDDNHRAIGTIDAGGGVQEFLFEPGLNDIEVAVEGPSPEVDPWHTAARFLMLGIEHIVTGYDHLLFVLALLLVSVRFMNLLKIVTAFTLAHAVTLSLAWFGIIDLPSRLVEVVIAISITYVAAENVLGRRLARRWFIAFGFGLVHGLGFFGILRQIVLPGSGAVIPLVAFNLGVEAGQVAILAVFYPLQRLVFEKPWYDRAMRVCSAAILLLAVIWIVQRSLTS